MSRLKYTREAQPGYAGLHAAELAVLSQQPKLWPQGYTRYPHDLLTLSKDKRKQNGTGHGHRRARCIPGALTSVGTIKARCLTAILLVRELSRARARYALYLRRLKTLPRVPQKSKAVWGSWQFLVDVNHGLFIGPLGSIQGRIN